MFPFFFFFFFFFFFSSFFLVIAGRFLDIKAELFLNCVFCFFRTVSSKLLFSGQVTLVRQPLTCNQSEAVNSSPLQSLYLYLFCVPWVIELFFSFPFTSSFSAVENNPSALCPRHHGTPHRCAH